MNSIFLYIEKYGLLLIILYCFSMLPPDLASKSRVIMNLDLGALKEIQSGSNIIKQVFWLLLFSIYLVLCFKKRSYLIMIQHLHIKFICLVFFMLIILLVSSSQSEFLMTSLKRILFQIMFIFTVSAAVFFSSKKDAFCTCVNIVVLIVMFLSMFLIAKDMGHSQGEFSAWASTKNNYGATILGVIVLLSLANKIQPSVITKYRFKQLLLFLLIIYSGSKTCIFLSILILTYDYIKIKMSAISFDFILLAIVSVYILIPSIMLLMGSEWNIALNMSPDALTGRGYIWNILYYDLFYFDRFWFGYGYGSYFGTGVIPYMLDDAWSFLRYLNSAHNGYLELLLQLGAIMSFLLLYFLYKLIRLSRNENVIFLSLIIFIYNITESALFRDQHPMWLILLIVISVGSFLTQNKYYFDPQEEKKS